MIIKWTQIRRNFIIRDRNVMIVNKNSNQSQALKVVCLHVLLLFTFSLITKAGKCAICVYVYVLLKQL